MPISSYCAYFRAITTIVPISSYCAYYGASYTIPCHALRFFYSTASFALYVIMVLCLLLCSNTYPFCYSVLTQCLLFCTVALTVLIVLYRAHCRVFCFTCLVRFSRAFYRAPCLFSHTVLWKPSWPVVEGHRFDCRRERCVIGGDENILRPAQPSGELVFQKFAEDITVLILQHRVYHRICSTVPR